MWSKQSNTPWAGPNQRLYTLSIFQLLFEWVPFHPRFTILCPPF
jgi:hypothetical protein